MNTQIYTEESDNIIWIWLDPVDKSVHSYPSPYREEIEEAYRNTKSIYCALLY